MMRADLVLFREPELEFRYGQRLCHPQDGLSIFGPYDSDFPSYPRNPNYIALGTPEGLSLFDNWAAAANSPSWQPDISTHRLWAPFPGYNAAFGSPWPTQAVWKFEIDANALNIASRDADRYKRAHQTVDLYLEGIQRTNKFDVPISVAICIVPDEIWENCRPEARVSEPLGEKISQAVLRKRKAGQFHLFDDYSPDTYQLSPDFRRQLKARAMASSIPVQIIRQSTLRLADSGDPRGRTLTPLSDRMWNLWTTIYYKVGGKPWRLVSARDGVCYIGIAFRRADLREDSTTACCAAQMFLNSGDGVVFLGEFGPWYSPATKQFQLTSSAAKSLLSGVLKTYKELEGKDLTEIFLHSRSALNEDAYSGFHAACPPNVRLVGIRARSANPQVRIFRNGKMPVIRGTFWKVSQEKGYLWCSGFEERSSTYLGWEVPRPLQLDIEYGEVAIERVAQDILGLTKLNFNACRNGNSEPVTIGFSDAVGEILISNPAAENRRANFKYYI